LPPSLPLDGATRSTVLSWLEETVLHSAASPVTLACPSALECSPSSLFRDASFATVDVHVGIDENT